MPKYREHKVTQTETWELVRLKNIEPENFVKDTSRRYRSYAYILLHKKRITNGTFEDELFVTIIPLKEISNYSKGHLWDGRSTWSIYANLYFKRIKFAKYGSFQIQDRNLRGRGLGSYILSDLVEWIKQYHPNFAL